jgi:hypothetical protein
VGFEEKSNPLRTAVSCKNSERKFESNAFNDRINCSSPTISESVGPPKLHCCETLFLIEAQYCGKKLESKNLECHLRVLDEGDFARPSIIFIAPFLKVNAQ